MVYMSNGICYEYLRRLLKQNSQDIQEANIEPWSTYCILYQHRVSLLAGINHRYAAS